MLSSRRLAVSLLTAGCAAATVLLSCSSDPPDAAAKSSAAVDIAAANPHDDTATPSSGGAAQLASTYDLSGGDLHVVYGPVGGRAVFMYQDALRALSFRGTDIHTTTSLAGTMVSVVIQRTIDSGYTTFNVLIPRVRLRPGAPAPVQTHGFTVSHRSVVPSDIQFGQLDSYGVIPLEGTAR